MILNKPTFEQNLQKYNDDYKGKYSYIKQLLDKKDDEYFLDICDELKSILESIEMKVGITEEQTLSFINDHLPAMMKSVLSRKFLEAQYIRYYRRFNALICVLMQSRLKSLQLKLPGDAKIFRLIFRQKNNYYDISYMGAITAGCEDDLERDVKECQIIRENTDKFTSGSIPQAGFKVMAFNINIFGQLGGFTKLKQIILQIAETPHITDMIFVKRLLRTIFFMIEYMSQEQYEKYIVPAAEAACQYLKNIPESELKLIKEKEMKKFSRAHRRLAMIQGNAWPRAGLLMESIDNAEAELGLKLFLSSSLQQRLVGIDLIKVWWDRLKCKAPSENNETENAKAKSFINWLVNINFVNLMLGENIHGELLKRGEKILASMYYWGALSGGQLADIFDAALNKHEAVQGSIFHMLEYITVSLTSKDAGALYRKITSTPLSKLKENMVPLIGALIQNEYFRAKKKNAKNMKPTDTALAPIEEQKGVEKAASELGVSTEESKHSNIREGKFQEPQVEGQPTSSQEALARRLKGGGGTRKTETNDQAKKEERRECEERVTDAGNYMPSGKKQDIEKSPSQSGVTGAATASTSSGLIHELKERDPFIPFEPIESIETYDVLSFVWTLTHEVSVREGLSLSVQALFIELFLSNLKKYYPDKRKDYLQLCEGMLASDQNPIQSGKIFIKIAESIIGFTREQDCANLPLTVEDLFQKLVMNVVKFKRLAAQKGLLTRNKEEEDEGMDTQSSIEDKLARDRTEEGKTGKKEEHNEILGSDEVEAEVIIEEEEEKKAIAGNVAPSQEPLVQTNNITISDPQQTSDLGELIITNDALKLTYYEELEQRLNILKFMATKIKQKLKIDSITTLWRLFLMHSFSKKEVEIFLTFIHDILVMARGNELVIQGYFDQFFTEILLRLDPKTYPLKAFSCLKEIMVIQNVYFRHIKVTSHGSLEIMDTKLLALNCIWELSLQSRDDTLQRKTSDFIHDIYKNISNELAIQKKQAIREEFLDRCMQNIKIGMSGINLGGNNESDMIRAQRAISMLCDYVQEFEEIKSDGKDIPEGIPDYQIIIHVTTPEPKLDITLRTSMKTKDAFQLILRQKNNNGDVNKFLFMHGGKIYQASNKTLWEEQILDGATIFYQEKTEDAYTEISDAGKAAEGSDGSTGGYATVGVLQPDVFSLPDPSTEDIETLKQVVGTNISNDVIIMAMKKNKNDLNNAINTLIDPAQVEELKRQVTIKEDQKKKKEINEKTEKLSLTLSKNNEYFEILYSLIDCGNKEIVAKGWSLLSKIPINDKIYKAFCGIKFPIEPHTAEETLGFYNSLFSFQSLYKYQYSLLMLTKLLQTDNMKSWIIGFLNNNGIQFLLSSTKDIVQKNITDATANEVYQKEIALNTILSILKLLVALFELSINRTNENLKKVEEKKQADQDKQKEKNGFQNIDKEVSGLILFKMKQALICQDLILIMERVIKVLVDKNLLHEIIKTSSYLLVFFLCLEEKYFFEILKYSEFVALLTYCLFHLESDSLRNPVIEQLKKYIVNANIIYNTYSSNIVAGAIKGEKGFIVTEMITLLLSDGIFPEPTKTYNYCKHYFNFIGELLEETSSKETSGKETSGKEISGKEPSLPLLPRGVSSIFLSESFLEKLMSDIKIRATKFTVLEDDLLAGYLNLLYISLREAKKQPPKDTILPSQSLENIIALLFGADSIANGRFPLVQFLVSELFDTKAVTIRRCTYKPFLQSAVKILYLLSQVSPEVKLHIFIKLVSFHDTQLLCSQKEISYEVGQKAAIGYVGLKNFGCTCYMNSLLQQLFMMPELRHKILSIPPEFVPEKNCEKVTMNLQKIFSSLSLSQQQYYAPSELYKDFLYEGRPINVCVQQDVDEFFNLITDKLEKELLKSPYAKLLRDIFEITVVHKIKSLEPEYDDESEQVQPHLSIPLAINNKTSVQDALDAFIKEEILDGENQYQSDKYNRKIKASKRCFIKTLGPTVILILKRFEFDYATLTKKKLNDYCEFPSTINFSKWMAEPSSDTYDLVGALIHQGGAEGGHYYSYIKERDKLSPNYSKWFEFNDTRVSSFDEKTLPKHAFGKKKSEMSTGLISWIFDWDENAYIVIYEKRTDEKDAKTGELKILDTRFKKIVEEDNKIYANTKIYLDIDYAQFVYNYLSSFEPSRVETIALYDSDNSEMKQLRELAKCIATQSTTMMTDTNGSQSKAQAGKILDEDSMIACVLSADMSLPKLSVLYAKDLIYKSKEKHQSSLKKWISLAGKHSKTNACFDAWLIKYMTVNKSTLFDLLIEASIEEIRTEFASTMFTALEKLTNLERTFVMQTETLAIPQSSSKNTQITKEVTYYKAASTRFIQMMLDNGFSYARASWKNNEQFFQILTKYAALGKTQCEVILKMKGMQILIDFLANARNSLITGSEKPMMGEGLRIPNFYEPLNLFSVLVRSCITVQMKGAFGVPTKLMVSSDRELLEMPEDQLGYLFHTNFKFADRFFKPELVEFGIQIFSWISWGNVSNSKKIMNEFAKAIFLKKSNDEHLNGLSIMKELFLLKDNLLKDRYTAFSECSPYNTWFFYGQLGFYPLITLKFTLDVLHFIAELMIIKEEFKILVIADKQSLSWVSSFIADPKRFEKIEKNKYDFVVKTFGELLDIKPLVVKEEEMKEIKKTADSERAPNTNEQAGASNNATGGAIIPGVPSNAPTILVNGAPERQATNMAMNNATGIVRMPWAETDTESKSGKGAPASNNQERMRS